MLQVAPWNRFPLTVQLMDPKIQPYCAACPQPPSHISIVTQPVHTLHIYQSGQLDTNSIQEEQELDITWFDCEELENAPVPEPPPFDEEEVWDLVNYNPSNQAQVQNSCPICNLLVDSVRTHLFSDGEKHSDCFHRSHRRYSARRARVGCISFVWLIHFFKMSLMS